MATSPVFIPLSNSILDPNFPLKHFLHIHHLKNFLSRRRNGRQQTGEQLLQEMIDFLQVRQRLHHRLFLMGKAEGQVFVALSTVRNEV